MITRTTTALLDGLADPADERSWREFDKRYRPIIVAFARRVGLAEADTADVAQETLVRFLRSYRQGQYDRERGRLRSWIIGITKHCIGELRQRRARRREVHGVSALADFPGDDELDRIWDAECQQAILREGLAELRERTRIDEGTLRAFELLAFEAQSPAEVAATLGITANDVYLAKHRCLSRLRKILGRLNSAYEVA